MVTKPSTQGGPAAAADADEVIRPSRLNCIDLSSSDIDQSVLLLKQACLDCGFFYVINHGISGEFMKEVFEQSTSFFALPLREKMKVLRNGKHRGYTPLLDELLYPGSQLHDCIFCGTKS